LGDRIAIMSRGQLRCVGSPLFLKKAYGVGYQLTIEKRRMASDELHDEAEEAKNADEQANGDIIETDRALRHIITSAVPEASQLSNSDTELSYLLPMGAASLFATMFDNLDDEIDRGTICSYGVSLTTIVRIVRMPETLRVTLFLMSCVLIFIATTG